ncbi:cyclic di-GMP phosphodiesterase response regulator RpfG [mine drainage metagenome]|uniref:Cyclic di-GMP phosphodiesterase response regulator RpfG n=1 Tax=mine drainage metagenome TaxID=410659 RepID=A0A1J5S0T9_9ZZZZ
MRIVLIDDSESAVTYMAGLIRAIPDCEALPFQESEAALDWCLGNDMDLIVVDYIMPGMDGLRFIERFRGQAGKSEVPVVMVTSLDLKDVRYKALQLGATDFLIKPIDPIEFVARSRNLLKGYGAHKALNDLSCHLAEAVERATRKVLERERETIHYIARTAEHRDPETGRHLLRMAHYSRLIARRLGLDEARCEALCTAAPLHDVGKVGIPDTILLKPGPLTDDERRVMWRHAEYGAHILAGSTSPLLNLAAEIAYCHHERYDGGGYPRGLGGEAIPQSGRIVALADAFDALTSVRPYKEAWSLERSLDYVIGQRGGHFDPACVEVFLSAEDEVTAIMRAFAEGGDGLQNRN